MSTIEFETPSIFSHVRFLSTADQGLAKSAAETFVKLGEERAVPPLPPVVFEIVVDTLQRIAEGQVIAGIPPQTELTSQQAAGVIGVLGSYMDKLLDSGTIPSHTANGSRLVKLKDLLEYDREKTRLRHEVLDELTQEAQEMGLY